MRTWRVGSVSMGLSMIMLGAILFMAKTGGKELSELVMSWWPLVLIMLGGEILLYVFFSKNEKMLVKYDFLSILFIGVLGTLSMFAFLFTSVGLMDEIRMGLGSVEMTRSLAPIEQAVPPTVEKIVLQTGSDPIRVDSTGDRTVHVFGDFRVAGPLENRLSEQIEQKYASVTTKGSTMYITLHELPEKSGMYHYRATANVTVVLPQSLQVEIRGMRNRIEVNPGVLQNNWTVYEGERVVLNLSEQADLRVLATSMELPRAGVLQWAPIAPQPTQLPPNDDTPREPEVPPAYRAEMKLGKGTYRLQVIDAILVDANRL